MVLLLQKPMNTEVKTISKTRGRFVGAWISREDHKAFKAECARDGRTIQNYLQRMISKLISKKP